MTVGSNAMGGNVLVATKDVSQALTSIGTGFFPTALAKYSATAFSTGNTQPDAIFKVQFYKACMHLDNL